MFRFPPVSWMVTDAFSAPRVLAVVGQAAVIQVAQRFSTQTSDLLSLDGILLSVTPEVVDGKVFLEGFAFAGKGKLGGDNGIKARAKRALEGLKEKGGDIDKIEMLGLFSIGGQPKVSLSVAGGSAFFLQPGQTRYGMKLIRVEGDKDPCAILETKGRQMRVYLNATRRTELVPMVSMKGRRRCFFTRNGSGQKWIFPFERGRNQLQGRAERSGRQTLILFSKIKFFSAS